MLPYLLAVVLVSAELPQPKFSEVLPVPHFENEEVEIPVVNRIYRIGSLPQNFVPPAPVGYYTTPYVVPTVSPVFQGFTSPPVFGNCTNGMCLPAGR